MKRVIGGLLFVCALSGVVVAIHAYAEESAPPPGEQEATVIAGETAFVSGDGTVTKKQTDTCTPERRRELQKIGDDCTPQCPVTLFKNSDGMLTKECHNYISVGCQRKGEVEVCSDADSQKIIDGTGTTPSTPTGISGNPSVADAAGIEVAQERVNAAQQALDAANQAKADSLSCFVGFCGNEDAAIATAQANLDAASADLTKQLEVIAGGEKIQDRLDPTAPLPTTPTNQTPLTSGYSLLDAASPPPPSPENPNLFNLGGLDTAPGVQETFADIASGKAKSPFSGFIDDTVKNFTPFFSKPDLTGGFFSSPADSFPASISPTELGSSFFQNTPALTGTGIGSQNFGNFGGGTFTGGIGGAQLGLPSDLSSIPGVGYVFSDTHFVFPATPLERFTLPLQPTLQPTEGILGFDTLFPDIYSGSLFTKVTGDVSPAFTIPLLGTGQTFELKLPLGFSLVEPTGDLVPVSGGSIFGDRPIAGDFVTSADLARADRPTTVGGVLESFYSGLGDVVTGAKTGAELMQETLTNTGVYDLYDKIYKTVSLPKLARQLGVPLQTSQAESPSVWQRIGRALGLTPASPQPLASARPGITPSGTAVQVPPLTTPSLAQRAADAFNRDFGISSSPAAERSAQQAETTPATQVDALAPGTWEVGEKEEIKLGEEAVVKDGQEAEVVVDENGKVKTVVTQKAKCTEARQQQRACMCPTIKYQTPSGSSRTCYERNDGSCIATSLYQACSREEMVSLVKGQIPPQNIIEKYVSTSQPQVVQTFDRVYPITGSTAEGGAPFFGDWGERNHMHLGTDLYPEGGVGGPNNIVVSPVDGKIVGLKLASKKYGVRLAIRGDKDGITYRFLHVAPPRDANGNELKVGDSVAKGQPITYVNGSGTKFGSFANSRFKGDIVAAEKYLNENGWGEITKPHLHFEVRTGPNAFQLTSAVDPGKLFPAFARGNDNNFIAGTGVPGTLVAQAGTPSLPERSPTRFAQTETPATVPPASSPQETAPSVTLSGLPAPDRNPVRLLADLSEKTGVNPTTFNVSVYYPCDYGIRNKCPMNGYMTRGTFKPLPGTTDNRVRTLDDYRLWLETEGEKGSPYVTGATDILHLGKVLTVPELTYKSANGKDYTMYNVPILGQDIGGKIGTLDLDIAAGVSTSDSNARRQALGQPLAEGTIIAYVGGTTQLAMARPTPSPLRATEVEVASIPPFSDKSPEGVTRVGYTAPSSGRTLTEATVGERGLPPVEIGTPSFSSDMLRRPPTNLQEGLRLEQPLTFDQRVRQMFLSPSDTMAPQQLPTPSATAVDVKKNISRTDIANDPIVGRVYLAALAVREESFESGRTEDKARTQEIIDALERNYTADRSHLTDGASRMSPELANILSGLKTATPETQLWHAFNEEVMNLGTRAYSAVLNGNATQKLVGAVVGQLSWGTGAVSKFASNLTVGLDPVQEALLYTTGGQDAVKLNQALEMGFTAIAPIVGGAGIKNSVTRSVELFSPSKTPIPLPTAGSSGGTDNVVGRGLGVSARVDTTPPPTLQARINALRTPPPADVSVLNLTREVPPPLGPEPTLYTTPLQNLNAQAQVPFLTDVDTGIVIGRGSGVGGGAGATVSNPPLKLQVPFLTDEATGIVIGRGLGGAETGVRAGIMTPLQQLKPQVPFLTDADTGIVVGRGLGVSARVDTTPPPTLQARINALRTPPPADVSVLNLTREVPPPLGPEPTLYTTLPVPATTPNPFFKILAEGSVPPKPFPLLLTEPDEVFRIIGRGFLPKDDVPLVYSSGWTGRGIKVPDDVAIRIGQSPQTPPLTPPPSTSGGVRPPAPQGISGPRVTVPPVVLPQYPTQRDDSANPNVIPQGEEDSFTGQDLPPVFKYESPLDIIKKWFYGDSQTQPSSQTPSAPQISQTPPEGASPPPPAAKPQPPAPAVSSKITSPPDVQQPSPTAPAVPPSAKPAAPAPGKEELPPLPTRKPVVPEPPSGRPGAGDGGGAGPSGGGAPSQPSGTMAGGGGGQGILPFLSKLFPALKQLFGGQQKTPQAPTAPTTSPPPIAPPEVRRFSCDPQTIFNKEKVTLSWTCSNNAKSNGKGFDTKGIPSGSIQQVVDTRSQSMQFGVSCGTSAPRMCTVTVLHPTLTIAVAPSEVKLGETAHISWAAADVTACAVLAPPSQEIVRGGARGTIDIPALSRSSRIAVVCATEAGKPVYQEVIVTVEGDSQAPVGINVPPGFMSGNVQAPGTTQPKGTTQTTQPVTPTTEFPSPAPGTGDGTQTPQEPQPEERTCPPGMFGGTDSLGRVICLCDPEASIQEADGSFIPPEFISCLTGGRW